MTLCLFPVCKKYAEYVYVKITDGKGSEERYDTCYAVEPLIVNGKDAMPREYPHMVSCLKAINKYEDSVHTLWSFLKSITDFPL